ncbi:MAG: hypothetical protein AAF938_18110 [Myxococcota bacterium]
MGEGPVPLMGASRAKLVRREIARLEELKDGLDTDWARIRWSGLLLPLTGVVFVLTDATIALFYFISVAGFWATGAYLIGVRRREYEGEIAELEINLAQLEQPESA